MELSVTGQAAEVMLKIGKFYTASTLGDEMGISAKEASGLLFNIRVGKKYKTVETCLPNRKVKVCSILGRKTNSNELWRYSHGHVMFKC